MKILLVDDNEGDILLTREALHEANPETEVTVVRDGSKALEYVFRQNEFEQAARPDLIILDINLPRKNGHEVLKILKSMEEFKIIPIIFLTTSTAKKDILTAYQNGVNCYVVKDFLMEDLSHIVVQIEYFWRTIAALPKQLED